MLVKNWMTASPTTVQVDALVKDAVSALMQNRIRHIPVLEGERLVGIISDRDLKRSLPSLTAGAAPSDYQQFMSSTAVREVMTEKPIICSPETDVIEAVRTFCRRKFGSLPVVENGKLVGIVTQTDVLRAYLRDLESN